MADEAPPSEEAPAAEPAPAEEAAAPAEPAAEPAAAESAPAEAPASSADAPDGEAGASGEAAAAEGGEGAAPAEGGDAAAEGAEAAPAETAPEEEEEEEEGTFEDEVRRPETAPVETEIEGFNDDFEEEELEEGGGEEEAEEDDDVADIELLVQEQLEEHEALREESTARQGEIVSQLLKRKSGGADAGGAGDKKTTAAGRALDGRESRYLTSLKQWVELSDEYDRSTVHYDTLLMETRSTLDERVSKAKAIRDAFNGFKREVALASENSRTGRPIPGKVVKAFDMNEDVKQEEVERVRLRNIRLRSEVRKLEARLRQKEELADGLHLIDFEQLKIENQSLSEKIEERNEELLKLRKKTTTTVQVLTHLKEKLQFVQKESTGLKLILDELEGDLATRRDTLQKLKASRESVKAENAHLKAHSGTITQPFLLDDLEMQKEMRDQLIDEIAELKEEFTSLVG